MPCRPGRTVLDAVLEAGGINDFASPNRTKLYRKGKKPTYSMFDNAQNPRVRAYIVRSSV
ncbi:MAG: hypothetical protein NUV55_12895 [Sulfuricaulis sp.]|uniref:hypothetical protein n=1 Tax=Sulfuricaulis sp. TaxID=2003553 RepID=UPI0025D4AA54|nr:hypothetical protein [Sulfuricaulis sp.]MCR4348080.1 hypothetical protein [Sulfuricaulis sp.]